MITREQIESVLNDDSKSPFQTKDIDHDLKAINLLRDKIPYEKVKSIIQGADHDIIYLPDVEDVLEHLDESDLVVLADCNVGIDEDMDTLFLFV